MIEFTEGRANSVRTVHELESIAQQQFADLSADEQKTVLAILGEMEDGEDQLLSLLHASHWERAPVSMRQFLTDDYYMGIPGKSLYPKLREDLISIFDDGNYSEIILAGSIGWGKSTAASFIVARTLYEISCLRDPQRTFGLSPGSEIHFALISKNLEQTRKVLRQKVIEPLRLSPYFQEMFPWKERAYEDVFPKNVIMFVASIGSTDRILGSNLFGAAVDEVNFLGKNKAAKLGTTEGRKDLAAFDKADKLYRTLVRRIKSRFSHTGKLPGKLCLISSKTVKNSFTERRVRESRIDPSVFVLDYATWHVKPKASFSGKWFNVLVGGTTARSKILVDDDMPSEIFLKETGSYIVKVPEEYREDFDNDLNGSLRDVAGVSVEAISQFIIRQEKIYDASDETLKHPFTIHDWTYGEPGDFRWGDICEAKKRKVKGGYEELVWEPKTRPNAHRHLHIDVALSGDSLGIAMGHIVRWKSVIRRDPTGEKYSDIAPEVQIDFMLRVRPPAGEQIFLPDIRAMVYAFQEHGFPVNSFSCDSFQSAEMIQQMKARGVTSEVISLDRTSDGYNALRQAFYEDRLKVYHYQPFIEECMALEYDAFKGKVDHPLAGSKDVADAVAGVIEGLKRHAGRAPLPMLPQAGPGVEDDDASWVLDGNKKPVGSGGHQNVPMPFISG